MSEHAELIEMAQRRQYTHEYPAGEPGTLVLLSSLADALQSKEAALEEAMGALAPFAEAFRTLSSRWEAHETHWQDALPRPITVSQINRAAEVLSRPSTDGGKA